MEIIIYVFMVSNEVVRRKKDVKVGTERLGGVIEFSSRWSLHQFSVDRMLDDAVRLSITDAHPSPVRPSVLLLFSSVRPPT